MSNLDLTIAEIMHGDTQVLKIMKGDVEKWPCLPYDAEVEWLESDGTAYIDTGIQINFTIDVVVEQRATVAYNVTNVRQLNGSNGYGYWGITSGNKFESAAGSTTKTAGTSSHTISFIYRKYNGHPRNIFSVDGTQLNDRTLNTTDIANYDYDVFIFALGGHDNAAAQLFSKEKVYAYQILFDGVLVRDYVPVRKSGVGYLYDKVSGELFGNANSSGAFTYGNDL